MCVQQNVVQMYLKLLIFFDILFEILFFRLRQQNFFSSVFLLLKQFFYQYCIKEKFYNSHLPTICWLLGFTGIRTSVSAVITAKILFL